jgi:hypothetical protein
MQDPNAANLDIPTLVRLVVVVGKGGGGERRREGVLKRVERSGLLRRGLLAGGDGRGLVGHGRGGVGGVGRGDGGEGDVRAGDEWRTVVDFRGTIWEVGGVCARAESSEREGTESSQLELCEGERGRERSSPS